MNATTSTSGNDVTVHCTGVSNAKVINVVLTGVTVGNVSGNITVPMGVLLGDVNGSGRVDSGDVSLVRQQTLHTVTGPPTANFREDINTSGRIDSGDVSIARQQTLTSLP